MNRPISFFRNLYRQCGLGREWRVVKFPNPDYGTISSTDSLLQKMEPCTTYKSLDDGYCRQKVLSNIESHKESPLYRQMSLRPPFTLLTRDYREISNLRNLWDCSYKHNKSMYLYGWVRGSKKTLVTTYSIVFTILPLHIIIWLQNK